MKPSTLSLALACALTSAAAWAGAPTAMDYAAVAEANQPSVVSITVKAPATAAKAEDAGSVGSGFVLDARSGYLLTNAHVVKDAKEVTVMFANKRKATATVVGKDERTDVAVLQVLPTYREGLRAVKLGDPNGLRVGEPVAAMGAPFGLDMTVTGGIVSAKNRNLGAQFVPFIQTDAAINPGNSGGPLFNQRGEVVGINSQIYSRSGTFSGLSFAIPINIATAVAKDLVLHGSVQRGKIGVGIQPLSEELAAAFGLPNEGGALVSFVDEKGPAHPAGLRAGDVVLRVDEHPVQDSMDLPRYVTALKPGTTLRLKVWREGQAQTVNVKVVALTDEGVEDSREAVERALGGQVRVLSPEEQAQFKVKSGLYLQTVKPASPAERAGLKAGDVLLQAARVDLQSLQMLQAAFGETSRPVALLVLRSGSRFFTTLPGTSKAP